jgi:hypothetical protein
LARCHTPLKKQKAHRGQLWALFFAFNGETVNQVGF